MRISQTSQCKRDIKQQAKRGKDLQKLKHVIEALLASQPLTLKNRDHALSGAWVGWRDCHVEPNWLLIYKISPKELILARTGTHSDLF